MNLLTESITESFDKTALEKRVRQQELRNSTAKGLRTNEMFAAYVLQQLYQAEARQSTGNELVSEAKADEEKKPKIPPVPEFARSMELHQKLQKGRARLFYNACLNIEALACSYLLQKYVVDYQETKLRGYNAKPVVFVLPNKCFLIYSPQETEECSARIGRQQSMLSQQFIEEALEYQSKENFENFLDGNDTGCRTEKQHPKAIIVKSPEELYDKVISKFSNTNFSNTAEMPSKDEFLAEFYVIKELIRINYESEKQRFSEFHRHIY